MGQNWDKFWLLFWKNWLLQIRHPLQTIIEILAPVLFTSLLVLIRSLVEVTEYTDGISFPPFQASLNSSVFSNTTLAWSPYNPKLEEILEDVVHNLNIAGHKYYTNSTLMQSALVTSNDNSVLAGVQFDDSLAGDVEIENNLDITLRFPGELRTSGVSGLISVTWFTNLLFPLYQVPGPRSISYETGGPPGYQSEGFLGLQQELSFSIINYIKESATGNTFTRPEIFIQRYPYPKWIDDPLLQALQSFVGLIIMLSFNYTCINIVRIITTEKEKQLKESMKIMGLPGWLHWTAWFVKQFIFLLLSTILIVILMKVPWYPGKNLSVFTETDWTVLFVFLLPFICATITFSFLISVFFSKANIAATIAGIVWFLTYAPYMFMQENYQTLSLTSKLVPSLLSNTAVAYGFQLLVMFEGNGEGFQWSNVWETASPDDDLVLGYILLMLVLDTILYLLIALYVEAVFPGKYGVPQKWYFPFTASYWCGKSHYVGQIPYPSRLKDIQWTAVDTSFEPENEENEFFEKEPSHLPIGINIVHLGKVYANKKVAVRDLSLNMYEDQITVLLGHNGAGKTTTMSMLTGMFPPTSGTATISGYDIRTQMESVRRSLGLCPQHNILFDELTVKDHFRFYSRLKGMDRDEIENEVNKYVEMLELTPKKNAKASTLSGGMKRKLCIGIALCGNSKVVMLDEPSSGVDPSARRTIWDILQSQKKGRTILLTTHFMDEADLLGDRIAIMAGGKLQCCGSSFFLKKKYGAGYHLIIDKMPNCDVPEVTCLLERYLSDVLVENNVGSELTYLLDDRQSNTFENMLRELETNSTNLGIQSYGISLTTLEEVFMKVGADHGQEEMNDMKDAVQNGKHMKIKNNFNAEDFDHKINVSIQNQQYLEGFALWRNQFMAMFVKRALSIYRSWILFLIQILIPVIFLIIAIAVGRSYDQSGDLPSLDITLDSYESPVTFVSGTTDNQFYQPYIRLINSSNHLVTDYGTDSLSDRILQETEAITSIVRRRYIVAASFDSDSITAWFNNVPYHGAPLSLGLVINTILKQEIGSDYSINIRNHPLPFTIDTKLRQLVTGNTMGFQIAFNVGFSMAFVSSLYIMFYIRERVSKAKHLQFVSGAKVLTFWGASFLNDLITFTIISIFYLITLVSFQEDGFKTLEDLGRVFSVLAVFMWAVLPLMYLASFCFSSPSGGYTRMTLINIFTGVAAFLVIEVLNTEGLDLEYIGNILHWIFLLIPNYSLSSAVNKMNSKFTTYNLCNTVVGNCTEQGYTESMCWLIVCTLQSSCCNVNLNYYEWEDPGIGRNITFSLCIGAALIIFLLLIEYRVFDYFKNKHWNSSVLTAQRHETEANDDFDVLQEKQKIRNATNHELQSSCIALRDVTKYYKKFLAVNNLCLTVDRQECFGLLGVNGAGKTTTFKIMTGDIFMSSGDAWVNGINLKQNIREIYKSIGYCPQFDALLDDLTGRETMTMFCLLRGLTYQNSKQIVAKLAYDFDFYRHLDKKVKEYSGGNKRKLSTAVALIGDPLIIYLDEPSTGMDPATKRHLWNVLCDVRDRGKCLVLTSHSMEECEALCTRLAIMVNGAFKCIGSVQHLKSKFSEGYTLNVKLRKTSSGTQQMQADVNKVKEFVESNFPGATLREEYQELLCYYIKNRTLQWSTMFGIMERGKSTLDIEDYSLGQSSLEQVFLNFTKLQRE